MLKILIGLLCIPLMKSYIFSDANGGNFVKIDDVYLTKNVEVE